MAILNTPIIIGGGNDNDKFKQLVDRSITELKTSDLEGLTKIGDYAFMKCKRMSPTNDIILPNTITTIGEYAFNFWSGLIDECSRSLIIPDSVIKIGRDCFSSTTFRNIECGNGLIELSYRGFYGCYAETIKLPKNLKKLGYLCLAANKMKEIDMPSTIETIDGAQFNSCDNLMNVYCRAITPPKLGSNAFFKVPADCVIHVPVGSEQAYKTATNWVERADYIVGDL